MIADGVKNIVKDSANVSALMGPGVDPHLYKATYGDVNKLTESDIIFYNGLHLEGKLQEIFKKLAKAKTVLPVSQDIDHSSLTKIPGSTESYDPHIWFDVQKWQQCIAFASKILQQKDSGNAAYYAENTMKYLIELDSLHQYAKRRISEIPPSQRVLITAHDAFGYFGKAYEIEVKGLQGISTLSEFGLKDVSELVQLIVNRKIKAVFVESSVPQKSIEAVVEGCKARGHQVKIGGNLYSDAMGNPGTPEGTYIGMVKANIETIVAALK
ncbi:metal ABC transporter solute-binding protein, Zn/Mn family [Rhodocytophaga rosea]